MAPLPAPQGTEVLLRVRACGVCHSDLHVADGHFDLGGGQRLVLGALASKLAVAPDPNDSRRSALAIEDTGQLRIIDGEALGGGSVAGRLLFQNHDLVAARNQLGQIAAAVAGSVNRQQALGLDGRTPPQFGGLILPATGPAGGPLPAEGFVPTIPGSMNQLVAQMLGGPNGTSPATLASYVDLSKHFAKVGLTGIEMQVVLVVASKENACEYCVAAHSTFATNQKIDPAVLTALLGAIRFVPILDVLERYPRVIESSDHMQPYELLDLWGRWSFPWEHPLHEFVWPEYVAFISPPLLVLKKGRNRRWRTSSEMPWPVSVRRSTQRAPASCRLAVSSPPSRFFAISRAG